ncbi:putative Short-chain dehydrogenase-reductase B [Hibiscus syriacus]|uniref:Short-chain dehydrogenase-reductase B n=1 Tax=Hibiscus syriacus TaxID=106335 RepID=A0A6A3D2N6_HIBSY|nr:putative Short-chain dehydrogenase-reductase B [Hibiscus syriacus]
MADHALMVADTSHAILDHSLVIGQEFPDVETCRRTLKDISIALHFDLRIVKSDRSRFIAKCSKEGCPWRVHIAKCPGVPTFSVRTLHGEHTYEGVCSLHHQQASVGWVARSVEARIRDNPQYKPKEILQDIRHGVAVSYMQAWRGKERSMATLHGTFEEGPLLELDKAELKGKYLGALLCAAAVDADDALFPLAIAIVDVESDDN